MCISLTLLRVPRHRAVDRIPRARAYDNLIFPRARIFSRKKKTVEQKFEQRQGKRSVRWKEIDENSVSTIRRFTHRSVEIRSFFQFYFFVSARPRALETQLYNVYVRS